MGRRELRDPLSLFVLFFWVSYHDQRHGMNGMAYWYLKCSERQPTFLLESLVIIYRITLLSLLLPFYIGLQGLFQVFFLCFFGVSLQYIFKPAYAADNCCNGITLL
jgi:hypothetical protein